LLSQGADPNARGARDQTALMWAAAQAHPEVVKVLLAHGADVRLRSEAWSQVMAVPPHGYLGYNRDIPHGNFTALLFAARSGDLASAKLLVAGGADVNDADAWGVSATALAAHSGYRELVEFLLEQGADPNLSQAGFSALHIAIMRRDERMVRALLARGADPNARIQAWTPIRRSAKDLHFAPELVGASPFWLAARFSQPGVMRLLAARGADPLLVHHSEQVTSDGLKWPRQIEETTALMAALGMGRGSAWVEAPPEERESLMLEAVKAAVELGVDVNAKDLNGKTALDIAESREDKSLAAYLAAHGALPGKN
jgi:ankyrin repeat protein